MNDSVDDLLVSPIIPVITINNAAHAVPLARALLAGGQRVIEVTFRTAAAGEAIRRMVAEMPQIVVAAGTLVTAEQVREALNEAKGRSDAVVV